MVGIGLGALVIAGGFAISRFGDGGRTLSVPMRDVTIAVTEQGIFHDFIPLRGTVIPRDTIYVDAVSGGQVRRVLVEPGERVSIGQPLVEFTNTELQLQVIQQGSQLNQAITQLQQNEIELEVNKKANELALAQLDYEIMRDQKSLARREFLAERGFTSQEVRDMIRDQLQYEQKTRPIQADSNARQEAIRQRQLPTIEEQLKELKKDLQVARSKLDDLIARSPVVGQVTEIDLSVGENKKQGERLAIIAPATGVKLQAGIDEFYIARVRPGETATMEMNDRVVLARVTRVYPQVKNGRFLVDLTFDTEMPDGLVTGQALQGRLALGDDKPAVVIPAGPFLERSGGDWVFVLGDDGRADRRRLKTGRRSVDQVEVLGGLRPGERVIVSDYTNYEQIDRIVLTQ